LEQPYAACPITSTLEGGNGGSGIPSATDSVAFPEGGSGGSGIPSAISKEPFPEGGNGGNGIPSAICIGVVWFVVVF
jgi:hypothetical protein